MCSSVDCKCCGFVQLQCSTDTVGVMNTTGQRFTKRNNTKRNLNLVHDQVAAAFDICCAKNALFVCFFKARLLHWVNNDIRYIDAHTEDKKSVFLLLNLIKRIIKSQAKAMCGPWGCKIKTFPHFPKLFFPNPV